MFYRLKKKIMCKALDKRNKQKPFDYRYAENYTLQGESDPLLNNSYYFSAHDEHLSIFARLGRRVDRDETWFAVFQEGRWYALKQESFPVGQSPLRVEKGPDGWSLSFQGPVNENDRVSFSANFVSRQKPIDFTSDMPAERMAAGIAGEKWSREYFNALQNVNGQCHYEQEGILEGQLTLDGRTVQFHLPCVRDHSFGKRDWNYMNNHLWLMAVSPALQFNYSLVSYPVITALEVGNCRNAAGMHYLVRSGLDFQEICTGKVPGSLSFEVQWDNGQTVKVEARVLSGISYHFQGGQYLLHENIAEFQIGGILCRGILEIGFNSDGGRYFNHRDLKSIQR